jgi:hypothetical protein
MRQVVTRDRKAVLKPPQSRRWRACRETRNVAKRLDCGAFTAAFPHNPNAPVSNGGHLQRPAGRGLTRPTNDTFCRRRGDESHLNLKTSQSLLTSAPTNSAAPALTQTLSPRRGLSRSPRTWPKASARGLRTRSRHGPAACRRQDRPIFPCLYSLTRLDGNSDTRGSG